MEKENVSRRSCPICEAQPLQPRTVQGVEIDTCARCGGLWFDAGKLERFPDRPSAKVFLSIARHAPGRCRRVGHPVGRALMRCADCGAAPAHCPACGWRLAMVPTPACAIDICIHCQGVWLDAGEFELLRAAPSATGITAARFQGWEIPEPSQAAKDPWLGPGQSQAPQRTGYVPNVRAPFSCRFCGASLDLAGAWAYEGDIYCAHCRPAGAVSSRELPMDSDLMLVEPNCRNGWGHRLLRLLIDVVNGGS